MIPDEHKDEWNIWLTAGYDSNNDVCTSPFNVITYPSAYGHLRPDNMPFRANYAFISAALLPALREHSQRPAWFWDGPAPDDDTPVVQVHCSPPPIDSGLCGLATIEPWVPMAFIPLGPTSAGPQW